jgi:hypothetical protein
LKIPKTPSHYPDLIPRADQLDEKIARVRAARTARTERSVRENENVGGGWGEIDREVMTDYQKKRLGRDPRPC